MNDNAPALIKKEELVTPTIPTGIVMPAVSAAVAVEAWKQYEELKKAIIRPDDIQKIQGREFLKKSYWRKLATFFNLSTEVVEEHSETIGKTFVWHFTVRAAHPNGRSAIGVGSCDAYEKAFKRVDGAYVDRYGKAAVPNTIHNIRSTAETRATNRAVSNLVGGGEVSAEEVSATEEATSTVADAGDYGFNENTPEVTGSALTQKMKDLRK